MNLCPNCGGQLESKPTRKTKCPLCGQSIYLRQGKLIGETPQATRPPVHTLPVKQPTKIHPLVWALCLFVAVACCGVFLIGQVNRDKSQSPLLAEQTSPARSIVTAATSLPQATNTLEPTPPPTSTPAPLATPTLPPLTDTPAPLAPTIPVVQIEKDVNLRGGPGTAYQVVGAASAGQTFNIIGRNSDSSWWQILVEDQPVWVAASVVKAANVDQEIQVAETAPPPPPTQAPTVAPTPTIVMIVVPPPAPPADAPPAGASAKCNDGTYSFSANRRGTCSHHGGVAIWY